MAEHTVLVVGATGSAASLGKFVVDYLLTKKAAKIHILVRKEKRSQVTGWESKGVKVFEGDLKDIESLKPAVKGVDTIVSCVQGEQDVIVGGQTNLLKVAVAAGVKRFYPSDFCMGLFTIPEQDNVSYAMRKQFHKVLEAHNMKYVAVYNGVFAETAHGLGFNFMKLCYPDQRKLEVYGDEYTLADMSTVEDTAKFTVESIFDPNAPKELQICSETLTIHKWKTILEQVTGKPWTIENKGSPEDLAPLWKKDMQSMGPQGWAEWMPKMYKSNLFNGQGKLFQNHTERYPAVKPTPIAEFIKANKDKFNLA